MSPSSRVVLALALLSLAGCAHAPAAAPAAPPAAALPWYGDLHALAKQAAQVRGLELTQQFDVVPLDDDAFFARFAALSKKDGERLAKQLHELLLSFAEKPEDIEALTRLFRAQVQDVQREQLIAFYYFPTHELVVRAALPAAVSEGDELRRAVLAHEVGHVLHDQLGLGVETPETFDEAMAHRALLEGDATLTATLLEGARKGLRPERAVERARFTLEKLPPEQLLAFTGFSQKLLAASPVVRAMFVFPYFQGQRFVADLYAAGGPALVKDALTHPPRTTAALYAPARWLADGERRFATAGPAKHVGALMTRILHEQCVPVEALKTPEAAEWLATQFVDDAVVGSGDTLRWSVAWAMPERMPAKGREDVARSMVGWLADCLGRAHRAIDFQDGTVGLAKDADGAKAAAALALTSPGPALGRALPIRPPRMELAFRSAGQGVLEGASWRHPKLGLTLAWPAALQLKENPAATVMGAAEGVVLMGAFVDEGSTRQGDDGFINAVLNSFLGAIDRKPADFSLSMRHEWKPVGQGASQAREAVVHLQGDVAARSRILILCDGRATFHLVGIALRPDREPLVEAALQSLTVTGPASLCDEP